MSPPFRRDLIEKYRARIKDANLAAVLALCYPDDRAVTHVAFILRKTYHGVHSAQIGFPGGRVEDVDDSLESTAVRETWEEIGVPAPGINVIREMTDIYIPPSNFNVRPYLGFYDRTPIFTKQEDEVEDIIEVPLHHILDDQAVVITEVETSYARKIEVPAFELNGHIVWGATAMILSEIKDLLKQAL